MCLLIASPKGKIPDEDIIKNATQKNPDGFGVAFPKRGRVSIVKFAKLNINDQIKILKKINAPYIAHWRFATSGEKNRKMAHPFRISSKCAFAHNGIIKITTTKELSDTAVLVDFMKSMNIQTSKEIMALLDDIKDLTGGSRFATIEANGNIEIYNDKVGEWRDEIWYSNDRCFRRYVNINYFEFFRPKIRIEDKFPYPKFYLD